MQKVILTSLILAALALLFVWSMANENTTSTEEHPEELSRLTIGEKEVDIEVADTPNERAQGLSGRLSIGEDEGMFFILEEEGLHGFWMKDMFFPIDIIWISGDLRVVSIKKNVSPDSYPQVFKPKKKAKYVLEVKAGFTDTHGIEIGDTVSLR